MLIFDLICYIVRGLRHHDRREQPLTTDEVNELLGELAAKNPEKLDWQHSIVDLNKLLGLDSSMKARVRLADELGYTGPRHDSAAMNVWLRDEVLAKVADHHVDSLRS